MTPQPWPQSARLAWASGTFSWLPTVPLCCRETFAEHGSKVDPPAMQEHDVQVLVLRLQTKGSVEQLVLKTSAQKRSLADRSITGMGYSVAGSRCSSLAR